MRPDMRSPVQEYLEALHARLADRNDGEVATYIPELAHADPRWFGICLATTDGMVYEVGDTREPFTIQSISKPFVYATALADRGPEAVFRKVGVEPSGDAFNAISLDPVNGRPANPMINAGAIAATGLLAGDTPDARRAHLLESFARYSGRPVTIDGAVYASERETGFRNHAIAFMLKNFGVLDADPEAVLDLYFQQCSLRIDCRDLAVMAALLAAGGIHPLTGERALDRRHVESALSAMSSCGMYDYAGEWTYSVGLPAKSGVSGGILAVLPGQFGIGIFSPPLDPLGNSVRGIAVCQELSRNFGLHPFNVARGVSRSVIHRAYTAAEVTSHRVRPQDAFAALKAHGRRIRVYELQGDLSFGTVEALVRDLMENGADADFLLLDLERVTDLGDAAGDLLSDLAQRLAEHDRRLLFTHWRFEYADRLDRSRTALHPKSAQQSYLIFPDVDLALEWCENRLLADIIADVPGVGADGSLPVEAVDLLRSLMPEEIDALRSFLRPMAFAAGDIIVREGATDDAIYLLTRGEVSVVTPRRSGGEKRVATFSAGMSFGEMAALERSPRSATIYADRDVECYVLHLDDLSRRYEAHPRIMTALLSNLAADLSRKLRNMNGAVGTLSF